MNPLPATVLFASFILLTACSPQAKPPIPSPDGSLTLHTSVESSHSDPTGYGCVVVEIHDQSARVLFRENTHASDFQRWGVIWTSNNQFRLNSSDIGTYTWTRQPDATWKKQ